VWDSPVSPQERSWWTTGGNGYMTGGIARLMRSSQRALANLRSPSSSTQSSVNGYSQIKSSTNSPAVSPQKQSKRIRASPSNLKDALERSAFGQSMSPSYDSIKVPTVISNKASVNEFAGLSAHAGFLEADEDWAVVGSSPRSRQPPSMQDPEQQMDGFADLLAPKYSKDGIMTTAKLITVSPNSAQRHTSPQVVSKH